MAILTGTSPVNGGNAGWTHSHVFDALEIAFAGLNMHGGTEKTGVPIGVANPQVKWVNSVRSSSYQTGWRQVGGRLTDNYTTYRYFDVLANGTTSYKILEKLFVTGINTSSGQSWTGTGELRITTNQSFTTGDAVVWAPYAAAVADDNITGLTQGTTYYIIRYSDSFIKLAASEADALAGTAIDLSGSSAPTNGWGDQTVLRRPDVAANENLTIETYLNDRLYFNLDASLPGNFKICSGSSYAADKVYNVANAGNFPYDPHSTTDYPTGTGAAGTETIWDTDGSVQSEDEIVDLGYEAPSSFNTSIIYNKIVEYCYANDTNATMMGVIKLLPSYNYANTDSHDPYWKYTVPGTAVGLASPANDLKLRIYRYRLNSSQYDRGYIRAIEICSITEGWSNNAVFTIPASAHSMKHVDPNAPTDALPSGVGSGSVDIVFGVNESETSSAQYDGKPNIIVTNFGATSSFFQKSDDGFHAILKVVNNSDKIYGTSYYSFSMPQSGQSNVNYKMMVRSGSYWDPFNTVATERTDNTSSSGTQFSGYFEGTAGLDYQSSYQGIPKTTDNNSNWSIAGSATSTSYPLEIRYYRDQAQDSNFCIIQFVQIINSIPYAHMTFTIPRGDSFGNPNPGMDLDYLYHGGIFNYVDNGVGLEIHATIPGYHYSYYSQSSPLNEPADTNSKTRDSLYGYMRNKGGGSWTTQSRYASNINVQNNATTDHVIYYRNDAYDNTNALANYYRPIKGIPIMSNFVPCPYYIPDDFVLIQISTAPGLTDFRPGDTVTVSGSEKYIVILGCVTQSQEGLNEIAGDSTVGMLLCGRVPN
tara:strand:- start:860 stop:3304 length:2445 start_codon:yes stop_codon:yes gene_type:complete